MFCQKATRRSRLVLIVDTEQPHSVLLFERDELGMFLDARPAPRRPHIDDGDLAIGRSAWIRGRDLPPPPKTLDRARLNCGTGGRSAARRREGSPDRSAIKKNALINVTTTSGRNIARDGAHACTRMS